jgi:oxygen-independent coproporphyrinogen-3 oxidase
MVKAFYPSEEVTTSVVEEASNYVTILLPEDQKIEIAKAEIDTAIQALETKDKQEMRRTKKHQIDITLYKELEQETGHGLAWGILMGVRPTKIAMKQLEAGMEEQEFVPWFQKQSLVSREKAELAWKIAKREKALLDQLDYENGYSLYIGIPFCPTVCSYCSFSSGALSAWEHCVEDYLDALCRELEYIASVSKQKTLNTIYIGGGTPTTLSAEQLDRVLTCVDTHFSREHLLEYTVEAGRPDSITREKFQVLRDHGISRISINPQSMQQKTLDAIGRKHSVESVYEAYHLAREMGFDNINMDIIAGLPGERLQDMEDTLAQIERLGPDNLTVHSLAIKRAAKMGQEYRESPKEREEKPDIQAMVDAAMQSAGRMGMSPYYLYRQKNIAGNFENVGYAKVDKAGIYNILIMEEKQSIIAAGAGASTKIVLKEPVELPGSKKKKTNLIRMENVKAIDAYIRRIDEMIERKGEWLWH